MVKIKEVEMENGCLKCISHEPSHNGRSYICENGKYMSYSRIKYTLEKGEIPKNYVVWNTCGDINCGNPDHMEIITRSESTRRIMSSRTIESYMKANDMAEKDIIDIYMSPANITNKELADKYDCGECKITNIRMGKSFVEITENLESPLIGKGLERNGQSFKSFFCRDLTKKQIEEIKNSDTSHAYFRQKYNISANVVRAIRYGKTTMV